jgi:hypothetical protein
LSFDFDQDRVNFIPKRDKIPVVSWESIEKSFCHTLIGQSLAITGCTVGSYENNSDWSDSCLPQLDQLATAINPLPPSLCIRFFHSLTSRLLPLLSSIHPQVHLIPLTSLEFHLKHLQTPFNSLFPSQNLPNLQKCLPKLLRRSPPLEARPQLERPPPPRRRKLARRLPPLPRARRRSVARPGRRHTPATSTKVSHSHRLCASSIDCRVNAIHLSNSEPKLTRTSVLKQVHPDTGISNRAMSILNSFVNGKPNLFFLVRFCI